MNKENNFDNFPKAVVEKMLERQEQDGNPRSIDVFSRNAHIDKKNGGFNWAETPEGYKFWVEVLCRHNFEVFYEKYPKNSESKNENFFNLI